VSGAGRWAGVGAGTGAVGLAAVLAHRTLTVVRKISRYADDIATAGEGVRRNTEIAAELARLRGLATELAPASAPAVEEAR
jgi:precorrin-6B methylase 2